MKATISIENGEVAPNDGLIKVWWWKTGGEFNQEWKADVPVWEIFNAHQTFLLCVSGETIQIDAKLITKYFTQIQ